MNAKRYTKIPKVASLALNFILIAGSAGLLGQGLDYPVDAEGSTFIERFGKASSEKVKDGLGKYPGGFNMNRELGGPIPLGPHPVTVIKVDAAFDLNHTLIDEYAGVIRGAYHWNFNGTEKQGGLPDWGDPSEFLERGDNLDEYIMMNIRDMTGIFSGSGPSSTFDHALWPLRPENINSDHGTATLAPFLNSDNKMGIEGFIRRSLTNDRPYLILFPLEKEAITEDPHPTDPWWGYRDHGLPKNNPFWPIFMKFYLELSEDERTRETWIPDVPHLTVMTISNGPPAGPDNRPGVENLQEAANLLREKNILIVSAMPTGVSGYDVKADIPWEKDVLVDHYDLWDVSFDVIWEHGTSVFPAALGGVIAAYAGYWDFEAGPWNYMLKGTMGDPWNPDNRAKMTDLNVNIGRRTNIASPDRLWDKHEGTLHVAGHPGKGEQCNGSCDIGLVKTAPGTSYTSPLIAAGLALIGSYLPPDFVKGEGEGPGTMADAAHDLLDRFGTLRRLARVQEAPIFSWEFDMYEHLLEHQSLLDFHGEILGVGHGRIYEILPEVGAFLRWGEKSRQVNAINEKARADSRLFQVGFEMQMVDAACLDQSHLFDSSNPGEFVHRDLQTKYQLEGDVKSRMSGLTPSRTHGIGYRMLGKQYQSRDVVRSGDSIEIGYFRRHYVPERDEDKKIFAPLRSTTLQIECPDGWFGPKELLGFDPSTITISDLRGLKKPEDLLGFDPAKLTGAHFSRFYQAKLGQLVPSMDSQHVHFSLQPETRIGITDSGAGLSCGRHPSVQTLWNLAYSTVAYSSPTSVHRLMDVEILKGESRCMYEFVNKIDDGSIGDGSSNAQGTEFTLNGTGDPDINWLKALAASSTSYPVGIVDYDPDPRGKGVYAVLSVGSFKGSLYQKETGFNYIDNKEIEDLDSVGSIQYKSQIVFIDSDGLLSTVPGLDAKVSNRTNWMEKLEKKKQGEEEDQLGNGPGGSGSSGDEIEGWKDLFDDSDLSAAKDPFFDDNFVTEGGMSGGSDGGQDDEDEDKYDEAIVGHIDEQGDQYTAVAASPCGNFVAYATMSSAIEADLLLLLDAGLRFDPKPHPILSEFLEPPDINASHCRPLGADIEDWMSDFTQLEKPPLGPAPGEVLHAGYAVTVEILDLRSGAIHKLKDLAADGGAIIVEVSDIAWSPNSGYLALLENEAWIATSEEDPEGRVGEGVKMSLWSTRTLEKIDTLDVMVHEGAGIEKIIWSRW